MKNLTIEQQKEFEKMIAKINGLHQENEDLVKNHNKEQSLTSTFLHIRFRYLFFFSLYVGSTER